MIYDVFADPCYQNTNFFVSFLVEADPVQLARHLTARPSAASAVSAFSLESMGIVLPDIVDAEKLHFDIPPLKVSISFFLQFHHNLIIINPYFQNPLPSSGESSCTTNVGTSRRSSYHGATNTPHLIQVSKRLNCLIYRKPYLFTVNSKFQEVRKSALIRKGSADSKWTMKQKQEVETTRKIKIFFSDTRKVDE